MVNELKKLFNIITLKDGNILSDKSCKYDTILLICRYIYEYKINDTEPYLNLTRENKDKVTSKIVTAFNKNKDSDGNGNYLSETLKFLIRIGVIRKDSTEKYTIINDDILQFITSSIENAYMCQYLAVYMAFKNDNIWNDYVGYCNINFNNKDDDNYNKKVAKLAEIKNKIISISPQITDSNSQWAMQTTEYYIMTLGLANDEYNVTRNLTINTNKLTPKDLSANVEGTRSIGKKDNFYIQDFRLGYVKKALESVLINNPIIDNDYEHNCNNKLTPEWFREKSKNFPKLDNDANNYLKSFKVRFSPDALKNMRGKELLEYIFLNNENKTNLCYTLEFDPECRNIFGSIKSGTSYKYGLHYSKKNKSWATGTSNNPKFISEQDAIIIGTNIRDYLLNGYTVILEKVRNNNICNYNELNDDLEKVTNGYIDRVWFVKYYTMLFPELFLPIYSHNAQYKVIDKLKLKVGNDNKIARMGVILDFVKKCNISNVMFSRVFWTFCDDNDLADVETQKNDDEEDRIKNMNDKENFNNYFSGNGINLIIYGTPGCGKSFELNRRIREEYKINDENIIRTTFYHDYSNVDFVGQIIPNVDSDGTATYKQNPGPFTKALCKSYQTTEKVALIIEELNRGDASSIFGDIFQLLDRFKEEGTEQYHKIGISEYAIENSFIQQYLREKTDYLFNNIRIPSNLYIFATMNTSDQNVITLDTAFKRRWNFEKMTNNYDNYDKKLYVPGIDKTWIAFVKTLNKTMLELNGQINEDKQFGLYFVDKALLCKKDDMPDENKIKKFAYKVFEYLWDDVVRFDRDSLFNSKFKTLDDLIDEYIKLAKNNEGMKVFNTDNLKEVNE